MEDRLDEREVSNGKLILKPVEFNISKKELLKHCNESVKYYKELSKKDYSYNMKITFFNRIKLINLLISDIDYYVDIHNSNISERLKSRRKTGINYIDIDGFVTWKDKIKIEE